MHVPERDRAGDQERGREKNFVDGDILSLWLTEFRRLSPTTFISYSYVADLMNSELDQKLY